MAALLKDKMNIRRAVKKAISEKNLRHPTYQSKHSRKTLEGPSTPLVPTPVVSNPQKEPEQNPETSTEKVQNPNLENTAQVPPPEEEDSIFMEIPKPKAKKTVNVEIQDLNSPRPNSYQPKLPYPERMKVRENDKPSAQHSRFLKMFKQLRLEIGLKDALVEMPKFNKWLSSLLRNKEKLEEIAITTVNAECSAIIMNKVPEKLKDPGKFLIPCALQELDRTSALADSGASINLLPHSIYKKLGLEALTPTRMTLELANRSITHPMGIAEDVVVRVDGFTFLADFVVVNFEPDPRVPIILGRPFLRTAKALIDLYEETLTLRVGKEELVYYADKSEKNKDKKFIVDDASHNLASEVISDHEPEQKESSITFSPRSDPLHHEFAGEPLTLPARNDREFEEYLSLMTNDDSEEEVNELPNLDHQDDPSTPRPPPEPSDIEKCFKPEASFTYCSRVRFKLYGIQLVLPVQVSAAEESDGFAEIIDFLKASSVHYALTVNPIIYTSCIQQFWATTNVKMVNGVRQLQALIDKKKVIITESSIRSDLHLEDAEGTDCLPTTTIFEELAKMGTTRLKRLKKVGAARRIESSNSLQESLVTPEDASKQGRSIEDIDDDVDVSLVDETQERQDDDLMFDTGVLEDDEMHVEAKVDGKDEQSTKPDDSTAGEAVTTASVDDSVVPTTIEEITLAQTLIQIKAAKPKVVTTAATTTTTRPKDKGVVV
ncbi:reverse transcriptase domain-containing protein [Tanacetum coccineum]|uniref:Reverse transcriptase domain-containing protein n=1 Tax=Tanacetum coccineum TaxID=301880 RepID=A0ABQ5CPZ6_9ASTR